MKRASICAGINSTMYSVLNSEHPRYRLKPWKGLLVFKSHPSEFFWNFFVAKESTTETTEPSFICDSVQIGAFACHPHPPVMQWTFAFNTTPIPFGPECLSRKVFPITVDNWLGNADSCFSSGSCLHFIEIVCIHLSVRLRRRHVLPSMPTIYAHTSVL